LGEKNQNIKKMIEGNLFSNLAPGFSAIFENFIEK